MFQFPKEPRRKQRRTHLKDKEEEEVGVGESAELLEEVQREEGEQVVFGSLDGVVLKHMNVRKRPPLKTCLWLKFSLLLTA